MWWLSTTLLTISMIIYIYIYIYIYIWCIFFERSTQGGGFHSKSISQRLILVNHICAEKKILAWKHTMKRETLPRQLYVHHLFYLTSSASLDWNVSWTWFASRPRYHWVGISVDLLHVLGIYRLSVELPHVLGIYRLSVELPHVLGIYRLSVELLHVLGIYRLSVELPHVRGIYELEY